MRFFEVLLLYLAMFVMKNVQALLLFGPRLYFDQHEQYKQPNASSSGNEYLEHNIYVESREALRHTSYVLITLALAEQSVGWSTGFFGVENLV